MKLKEPYFNFSWPVYIIFVTLGCVLAKVLFDGLGISSSYNLSMPIIIYDILLLLYGLVACLVVYQCGKAIFAKIAGFDILYFNLVLIGFKRVDGKLKCFFGGKEGFSFEVKIVPNKNKKQNITLALLGGTISTLIVISLTYGLLFGLGADATTKCFFIISSFFYVFAIVAYMIPFKMDSINDGFALYLIKKYKLEDVYLSNLLNLKAMYDPSEKLEYVEIGDHNDPLSMDARINNFYYAIRNEDEALIKKIAEEISLNTKYTVGDEKASIALIAQAYSMCLNGQFDELKDFFWKLDSSSRKVLRNTKNLQSLKAGLYISGKIEDSREGLYEIISSIDKCAETYKYTAQKDAEVKLVNKIKEQIFIDNPDLIIDNENED